MTRLLTLTVFAVALFLVQPTQAQQQDTQKDKMEMKQDFTVMKEMMQKMMENDCSGHCSPGKLILGNKRRGLKT